MHGDINEYTAVPGYGLDATAALHAYTVSVNLMCGDLVDMWTLGSFGEATHTYTWLERYGYSGKYHGCAQRCLIATGSCSGLKAFMQCPGYITTGIFSKFRHGPHIVVGTVSVMIRAAGSGTAVESRRAGEFRENIFKD